MISVNLSFLDLTNSISIAHSGFCNGEVPGKHSCSTFRCSGAMFPHATGKFLLLSTPKTPQSLRVNLLSCMLISLGHLTPFTIQACDERVPNKFTHGIIHNMKSAFVGWASSSIYT